jgi:uncharacterized protein
VIDAGPFAGWLTGMEAVLRGEADADVACGRCTACCRSAQFVRVDADEVDALAHIPVALLFPAPYGRRGERVMGYDERGRCPMLTDGGCSIYEHRPRACRVYDCRVFAAADVAPDHPAVSERVVDWHFRTDEPGDERLLEAVRAAARSVQEHTSLGPTLRAVAAVRIHDDFLDGADPDPRVVQVRVRAAISRSPG